ncbi:hypothetical protein C8J55DRAFT_287661 [Lentinula edodes]|uniref:Transmembrane protein n=1 Tax=Lentinula lateritia TaxID=40482 RepID=A0A9W8ZS20_9AGAR|nr:hypothetical protein C8J55DRAFT_287661 [Lentinula edodes]
MFSTRTPLLPLLNFLLCRRFRKLPTLSFFVGSMIIQLCGSSTTRLIAEPEASSVKHMIFTPFPSTNVRQMYPTRTMLASSIASPWNDSNTDSDSHTENPDSNLTDPGATPPHPSRVTVAFLILGVGLCLFSIYFLITHHPPSHLINKHVRPTISHISDRLPNSLIFLSQRLAVLGNRLSAHLPGVDPIVIAVADVEEAQVLPLVLSVLSFLSFLQVFQTLRVQIPSALAKVD